jgi:8-oxo-dGTP diphosphatase
MNERQGDIEIGVGAVVFRGGDVLLVRRRKPPFRGGWSIPGGRLRRGEPLTAAAAREVREEAGVEICVMGLVGVFEALPDAAAGRHWVLVDYWAEWRNGAPNAGDDAAAAEFAPLAAALDRVAWDATRAAIATAAKLRNDALQTPRSATEIGR